MIISESPDTDREDTDTPPLDMQPHVVVNEEQSKRSLALAMAAAETAHDNRGTNIAVLDLRRVTPVFDYFVVATGTSRRQLHAISEEIDHRLEDELKDKRMGIEGYSESRWILLDYGSVVVHLFDDETRDYYALENLWADAERVPLPWDDEAGDDTPGDDPASEAS
ncbi:Ribosomal silencing factor RsfS [Pseudobythopirellula maris]|uniref:Ribosomal silencing factor RsfS n=1 Tax=Pseudobythopirellula maris TaxID=2527991 RepID=A0A5C5ZN85_9BACT|nr:ribosome silencing factor [Pseudobythopirellula maris]TWT88566.1 Ribosomal silencing factor RsfS [Pseudobythopirellula maris]